MAQVRGACGWVCIYAYIYIYIYVCYIYMYAWVRGWGGCVVCSYVLYVIHKYNSQERLLLYPLFFPSHLMIHTHTTLLGLLHLRLDIPHIYIYIHIYTCTPGDAHTRSDDTTRTTCYYDYTTTTLLGPLHLRLDIPHIYVYAYINTKIHSTTLLGLLHVRLDVSHI